MYTLIILSILLASDPTGVGANRSPNFKFHDFGTKEACEAAKRTTLAMAARFKSQANTPMDRIIAVECVPTSGGW